MSAAPAPWSRPVIVTRLRAGGCVFAEDEARLLSSAARTPADLAVDIDPAAVRCARRNVATDGAQVYEGDLYGPLPAALRGRVDILVANAPYVSTGEIELMPPEARIHEPRVALDGGADGLTVQRGVIATAPQWLAPGGYLLVETSARQAPQTADTFARHGLIPRVAGSAQLDATVVTGTLAPSECRPERDSS